MVISIEEDQSAMTSSTVTLESSSVLFMFCFLPWLGIPKLQASQPFLYINVLVHKTSMNRSFICLRQGITVLLWNSQRSTCLPSKRLKAYQHHTGLHWTFKFKINEQKNLCIVSATLSFDDFLPSIVFSLVYFLSWILRLVLFFYILAHLSYFWVILFFCFTCSIEIFNCVTVL